MIKIKRMLRSPSERKKLIAAAAVFTLLLLALTIAAVRLTASEDETLYTGTVFQMMTESQIDLPTDAITNPDRELRGVWIASVGNINYPSKSGLTAAQLKAELDDIVEKCKEYRLNAIFFQVRPAADALYESDIFPTSQFVTGTQGADFPDGFDSLAYLIEIADEKNIDVHAWVNPLRITYGSASTPRHDITELAESHPGRLNPDWIIAYDDGKLYFDAGIPQVQSLIADGVREIVAKYDVVGVVFDDYFYPYPASVTQNGKAVIAEFDDDDTYKTYGAGFESKSDWRRDNINKIVEGCYKAVKEANPDCLFGIAPFGIWRNNDGKNGGSDTSGLDSYSQIYCDALAWIKGGYIDYIAPQIYWQFSTKVARYDVLCRWWNAQVDGTGVDLMISHAAYRSAEFGTVNEIRNQVEFARSELGYRGSIFYGWDSIKADDMNLQAQLAALYADEIIYSDPTSDGRTLEISSPVNGSVVAYDHTYVLGSSDPAYPLTIDGAPVSRTKDGYFSLYLPLDEEVNTFTFSQNGVDTDYTIKTKSEPKSEAKPASTADYVITSVTPSYDYMSAGDEYLTVTAMAPAGSKVTVTLSDQTVRLEQKTFPEGKGEGKYLIAQYAGSIRLPRGTEGKLTSLGNVVFTATKGSEKATKHGGKVRLLISSDLYAVEVIKENSDLKIATDSWFYDDYTSASVGMRDYAVYQSSGYYKLRMGGYIETDNVKVLDAGTVVKTGVMSSVGMSVTAKETVLSFDMGENLPMNGFIENGEFVFCFYNMDISSAKLPKLMENPLFSEIRGEQSARAGAYRYYLKLKDPDNFYGFEFRYDNGTVNVVFRNPQTLAFGDLPLAGKTIVVDAGHGGKDSGAVGPRSDYTEADMNLDISLSLAEKLTALGAEVILTRDEDETFEVMDRVAMLDEIRPDLAISVHQNSMLYNADITKIRGLVALHFAESGSLLTKCVSSSLSDALNRYERTPASQRLALVRNPKFPSTLVEVGFITCVEEYDKMYSESAINQAAQGLADGILDYYRAQEAYVMK